ncbi:MFS family permease [Haloferula luteola]|uniref:MFS family permease n=1 Tax=Haloferula luteola TaxID=595692 RepID=A0A840VAE4_9BACT|nr:MFS transporter [Haloferula luteola]MBB5350759.1 MFS family permease [Haloferula luteola]
MNAHAPTPSSLWSDLRQLPRCYWILFSGTLINRFGHFVMPFLALYLKREGHPAWVTGASLAAYGAGGLIANITGGYCADRLGRKPTILFSCCSAALAMLALSQAHTANAIITCSAMVGLASSMYFPASSALLADLVPEPLRIRAFGCQRLAVNLGFALGMMTAGALAAHSFLWLFIVDAATTAVLGLLVLMGLPGGQAPSRDSAGWGIALHAMQRHPAYLRAVFASFCIAMVFWQLSSSWGLHVTEIGGHSEKTYGLLMAINGLMIVALELPLTSVTRRYPAPKIIALGYVGVGVAIGLSLLGGSLPLLTTIMVLFTLGEMIALPVSHSFIAQLAPNAMRGRFMGILGVAWSSATMIGPAAGLALFEHSPEVLWISCLGLGLAAAATVASIPTSAEEPVPTPRASRPTKLSGH